MDLLNCPFCGAEAELKHGNIYGALAVRVKCTRCYSATEMVMEGRFTRFKGEANRYITAEEAEADAIRRWNSRIGAA